MLFQNIGKINFFFILFYLSSFFLSIYFINKFIFLNNFFYLYLFTSLFIFNSIILLILRSSMYVFKINLLIFLYLLIITFYSIEGYIGLAKYNLKKSQVENVLVDHNDDYKINPSLNDLKYYKKNHDLLPLGLISNYKTKLCNEEGYWAKYISDKYGFRNENKIWDELNLDFLFLGDSFGIGSCVNDQNEMSYLLHKNTRKKVLNLSIQGTGPLKQYATFIEYGKKFKPKKIIWFFYEGNDLMDLNKEIHNSTLLKYYENYEYSQDLKSKQVEINNIYTKAKEIKKNKLKETNEFREFLSKFLKLYEVRSIITDTVNIRLLPNKKDQSNLEIYLRLSENYKNIIKNLNFVSQKWEGEIVFVYLPSLKLFYDNKYYQDNSVVKMDIFDFLNKENIKIIDMFDYFNKNKTPSLFFNNTKNAHYTKKTYSLIVDEIQKQLNQN